MSYDAFLLLCEAHGLPPPQTEYCFSPPRKFRADYCWPDAKIIVEKNGGIWKKGGHSSGTGLIRDYEKGNLAQLSGFIFLVYTPRELESGSPLPTLKILLKRRLG
jgi:hypothetical protein